MQYLILSPTKNFNITTVTCPYITNLIYDMLRQYSKELHVGNQKSMRKETYIFERKTHTCIHMKKVYFGRASVLAEHHL